MPRVEPIQESFTTGEVSPLLWGRPSLEKYKEGLAVCENFLVQPHGPVNKRGGTRFVKEVKTSSKVTILQEFDYKDEFQYVLEIGDLYIRFFRAHAYVAASEIVTTYTAAQVRDLRFEQDAETLYIVHKDHIPRKLERDAHATWRLIDMNEDGIDTVDTITHGGDHTTGTYTGVALGGGTGTGAEATVIVNADGDVTSVLITNSGTGYLAADAALTIDNATIGGAADATVDVLKLIMMNTPPAWGAANYPTLVFFFELRLFFAATTDQPNWVWGSKSATFEDFDLGTGADSDGIALEIKQATKLLWVTTEDAILFGAHNREIKLASNSLNEALTPDNMRPSKTTSYGSTFIPAVQIDSDTLFVQRGTRKVRRLQYEWRTNSFKATPLTILSNHITSSGIEELAYSNEPDSYVWARRTDGTLVAMTYEPDNNVFGWHRHLIGGTDVVVKSLAVIDGATEAHKDEVWMIVSRTIGAATVQYIEYLVPEGLDLDDDQDDAFFVDSGLTTTGVDVAEVYAAHLIGDTVRILADGAVQPEQVVGAQGIISIDPTAATIHFGLAYDGTLETLPIEGGNPIGTAQTKIKRIVKMALRLYRSSVFYYGPTDGTVAAGTLDVYPFMPPTAIGSAPALFTGDTNEMPMPTGYDTQGRIKIVSQDPVPLTVSAIVYAVRTGN